MSRRWFVLLMLMPLLRVEAQPLASQWVYRGSSGRLLYLTTARGDRIPDFSGVGYHGGGVPLPDTARLFGPDRVVTAAPSEAGDDGERIQQAIDQVSSYPLDENGFRGMVELAAGEFRFGGQLRVRASGVILRGAGDGEQGTLLRAMGTSQRPLILVDPGTGRLRRLPGSERRILDMYVPAGATSLRLESTDGLRAGDTVIVHRPSTAEWLRDLGMDRIPGQNVTQWTPGSKDLLYERLITRVEGHRIFLDAPVCNSFDQRYGGGTVYKYEFPERIENVGIENLGGDSDFHSPTDEDHSWEFIRIDRTQNAWVRNITARHFAYAAVNIGESARSVTVEDSACLDPISQVTGSRRYSFNVDGQMCLVRGVRTRSGRHDFVQGSLTHGPNVFLRSRAERALDESGPHHRWSTGTLFDNVTVEGNALAAWNRGASGTGHGWSGANMVYWNCQARWFRVQNPFTAQNWVIGGIGDLAVVKDFLNGPAGIFDSHGHHVSLGDWPDNPDNSLYVAQLAERLSDPGGPPREYTLGDYDEFGDDGPGSEDQAPVSPDWLEQVGQYAAAQGAVVGRMDLAAPRQFVPLTFEFGVEPGERIVAATLTLAVQRSGAADRSVSIWLGRMDDEYRLISGGLQPGGSQGEEGAAIIMLEVPQPWLALLGEGRLNAAVSDALAVDWARLDVVAAGGAT